MAKIKHNNFINRVDEVISDAKIKWDATIIPKVAYTQVRDNFSMELMGTLQNEDKKR
ncbi:hypothetical protein [Flavobacterium petrolei]|uniref:hypothetical protein n=1 Tax=Flavobacterium petrolei TaxID=2259594 RepID=UPI003756C2B2